MMSVSVNKDNFFTEVTKADGLVIVDFYLDGCVPCKRLSPILYEIEKEFKDKLKIAKINTGFNKELVDEYEVLSAPTLLFFKNGEEKERLHGALNKAQIIRDINQY